MTEAEALNSGVALEPRKRAVPVNVELLEARSPSGYEMEAQIVFDQHVKPSADSYAHDALGKKLWLQTAPTDATKTAGAPVQDADSEAQDEATKFESNLPITSLTRR